METIIQYTPRGHEDRNQRWARIERADLFERYGDLHAQGISQRQAAQGLDVPRSTRQTWRAYQASLDESPAVVAFFHSVAGLACLQRLVLAIHLVCVEGGACGIRLVCLLWEITGLDRFVGASYGAQQQVNRGVEEAIVADRRQERARLAQEMPPKEITRTQDETCTGGLCLVGREPVSHDMVLAQLAAARAQDTWQALMEPALSGLNGRVIQSTSAEAPGLLAYGEHHLGAHHSPDVFPVQHELIKAVSGPMAATQRAAEKAVTTAQETLQKVQAQAQGDRTAPERRGPGRPPKATPCLEQANQAVGVAHQEPQRLTHAREKIGQSIRAIGHASHVVDLARGGRRNGTRMAGDSHGQLDTSRQVAQQAGLSQRCRDRLDTAERVVPKMPATIEFVSTDVRQQVDHLDLTPPESYAMHARLMPSYDLERVATTKTISAGQPLRELADRIRTPLFESGGALSEFTLALQDRLKHTAATLAEVFQRSSSNVEGRNGSLSLRNHHLRGLDHPRKRACLTAVHNFFLTRADGTTAAERCFGQKPRSMFAAILASVGLPPAPLSPPRRAAG